jgi:adenosylcobinamide-GDP ribazoletransferase
MVGATAKGVVSELRGAIGFLTIVGGASEPRPSSLPWFPVVGAALGLVLGGVWHVAADVWPAPVAASVVVALDLLLTGMLHFDGLIDAADGLLPHLDRDRRLDVMASPGAGAFGVTAAVAVLLLRWSVLATSAPDALLLAGVWAMSRTVMAVGASALPYARDAGLASPFVGGRPAPPASAGATIAIALAVVADGIGGVVTIAAGVAGGIGVLLLARQRVGGFTGDVLGAAGVVAETCSLLVASA